MAERGQVHRVTQRDRLWWSLVPPKGSRKRKCTAGGGTGVSRRRWVGSCRNVSISLSLGLLFSLTVFFKALFLISSSSEHTAKACEKDPREASKKGRWLRGKSLLLCALMLSTVLGFALLLAYTILTGGLGTRHDSPSPFPHTRPTKPCDTEECLMLLARLLEVRNATIDPCEDFYGYACGNWEANHLRTETMESSNVFDVLLEENQLILKRLLEVPQLRVGGSAKGKAIQFYHSCMDTQQIEAEGAQPLKELINQVGGWNFTGPGKQTDFNQTLQTLMGKYNTFPFFRAYVGPSSSDPSTNIIQIDHPEFEMPPESDYNEKANYPEIQQPDSANLAPGCPCVFLIPDEAGDTVGRATECYLHCHLLRLVLHLQSPEGGHPTAGTAGEKDAVLSHHYQGAAGKGTHNRLAVMPPGSLPSCATEHLPANRSARHGLFERVLQIYMILCLVGNLSPALDSRFQDARRELFEKLHGKTGESGMVLAHRWRKCLSDTSTFFEPVLAEMIVQEIFPQETKELAEKMFSLVRDALHSRLDQVEWMDEQTRQEAKDKVSKLQVEIGYPDSILQTAEMDREFQDLEIHDNTFLLNVVACLKAVRENFSLRLLQPHLQDNWEVFPWSVHSYYSMRRHTVVFPAGMFRSPFFHAEFPSAVNFGAMGVIMAHELLHAVYDYVVPESCPRCNRDALVRGTDCLVEQYERYSLQGLRINGTFTLLENAADTGGLAIAYQAYKNWLKKHKQERNLPRSGLSHYQLFYISFANGMCGHQSPERLRAFLHRDPHSPPPLRVRGPLSNSQDFARHFHCSSTTPMNPAFKCHIW
ncbi:kell blood group glycoprotein isoform X2 [Dermochelys coriacea]|uniref:kell blood group glycoprotein isoform X2 n=1 Tax=Dermochelys coriacea TaxID=27794 RepID=UPI001CA95A66|nr:kell blood group glycoprotein isoform X2 [Dermochelys coriacea]